MLGVAWASTKDLLAKLAQPAGGAVHVRIDCRTHFQVKKIMYVIKPFTKPPLFQRSRGSLVNELSWKCAIERMV